MTPSEIGIYFGDHSRRSLRERNINIKPNVEILELHATFAERMATEDGFEWRTHKHRPNQRKAKATRICRFLGISSGKPWGKGKPWGHAQSVAIVVNLFLQTHQKGDSCRGRDGHCWAAPRTDPYVKNYLIRLLP